VADEFPDFLLARLPTNRGFAYAANAGLRLARGSITCLLNNDAVAEARWVEELVAALQRHPEAGSAASKILLRDQKDTINSAGDLFLRSGVPNSRGVWELDRGQYDEEVEVFGACAAAAAYQGSMLDEIGLFDERLFMYCEDVDLALRAQVAGYPCIYAPRAVVWHRLSASAGGDLASFQCGRNFILLLARDVPSCVWRDEWPNIVATQVGLAASALRHVREPAARARLRGMAAGLLNAPSFVAERSRLMENRRVSDQYLAGLFV